MEYVTRKPVILNRRRFMHIVAVAGTAVSCWQLGLFGTGKALQKVYRSQSIMGTVLNLTVYGPDRDSCEEVLARTIEKMVMLEGHLSRHKADSELAELNRSGSLANPSPHLLDVLRLAEGISKKTSGAFDVTILPLLQMHESLRGQNDHPDEQNLNTARGLVGYENLSLDKDMVRLAKDGMGISLDGIGKGYIVDQGVSTLRSYGFTNVYVEAGGDLMVSGQKEQGLPWRIGLRSPRPQQQDKPVVIEVSNKAVATSGDYLQAFTPDLKHHHIVHPRSGFSPQELASCTITAPTVALADGLATAVMVLGKNDGLDLVRSMPGCEGYVVDKKLSHFNTAGFFA
ncbi:MAG: FAD:protein FMN transferase [Proteobacteria bacterium]|nr:FAD:protein FMN transferase [Pseudomonadota bacterium]MBU1057065.1 FAD:protein FMN transferase [Pseudomonadota bacterium]